MTKRKRFTAHALAKHLQDALNVSENKRLVLESQLRERGMLAVLIEVDGTVTGIELDSATILENAREHIKGWITAVTIIRKGKTVDLLCDEEGSMKGLPENRLASIVAATGIVGPAIILPCTLEENERNETKKAQAKAQG